MGYFFIEVAGLVHHVVRDGVATALSKKFYSKSWEHENHGNAEMIDLY